MADQSGYEAAGTSQGLRCHCHDETDAKSVGDNAFIMIFVQGVWEIWLIQSPEGHLQAEGYRL